MTPDAAARSPGQSSVVEEGMADIPAPTLLVGLLTAVAAGVSVGWALAPLSTTVAGLPLYAVVAVATTLWSGIAFLRRKLPTGVLAEGFYLMGVAVLGRPIAVALSLDGLPAFLEQPGAVFATFTVAIVVATLLVLVGWRLDTHARKARIRKMRRRVGRKMAQRRAVEGPGGGTANGQSSPSGASADGSDGSDGSVSTGREP